MHTPTKRTWPRWPPWAAVAALVLGWASTSMLQSRPPDKDKPADPAKPADKDKAPAPPASSYDQISPVLLGQQTFADMRAKDMADKPEVMARQTKLLDERYDTMPHPDP